VQRVAVRQPTRVCGSGRSPPRFRESTDSPAVVRFAPDANPHGGRPWTSARRTVATTRRQGAGAGRTHAACAGRAGRRRRGRSARVRGRDAPLPVRRQRPYAAATEVSHDVPTPPRVAGISPSRAPREQGEPAPAGRATAAEVPHRRTDVRPARRGLRGDDGLDAALRLRLPRLLPRRRRQQGAGTAARRDQGADARAAAAGRSLGQPAADRRRDDAAARGGPDRAVPLRPRDRTAADADDARRRLPPPARPAGAARPRRSARGQHPRRHDAARPARRPVPLRHQGRAAQPAARRVRRDGARGPRRRR
jgi:hypothetical protein